MFNFPSGFYSTIFKNINTEIQEDILQTENNEIELENLQYDGLENLAGYICHKLKNENPNLEIRIDLESRGLDIYMGQPLK